MIKIGERVVFRGIGEVTAYTEDRKIKYRYHLGALGIVVGKVGSLVKVKWDAPAIGESFMCQKELKRIVKP